MPERILREPAPNKSADNSPPHTVRICKRVGRPLLPVSAHGGPWASPLTDESPEASSSVPDLRLTPSRFAMPSPASGCQRTFTLGLSKMHRITQRRPGHFGRTVRSCCPVLLSLRYPAVPITAGILTHSRTPAVRGPERSPSSQPANTLTHAFGGNDRKPLEFRLPISFCGRSRIPRLRTSSRRRLIRRFRAHCRSTVRYRSLLAHHCP